MTHTAARLELRGASKTFGSTRVLTGVDLAVGPGEVLGVAGQNGSGKSTLIKILTGFHPPDPGATLRVDGEELHFPLRWRAARGAGVSVVHQDLGLLDHLSLAENICVGAYPTTRWGRIDRRKRDALAANVLSRVGIDLDPQTIVSELSPPERAEVAIARALRDHRPGRGVLILDESTRALQGADLQRVHGLLRRIVDSGSSAIMISHNLHELTAVTDRVAVLRDGRLVAELDASTGGVSESRLAQAMLGDPLTAFTRPPGTGDAAPEQVVVRGLGAPGLEPIDLSIRRGEVVGLTGRPGTGFERVPELLIGATRATTGVVEIGDRSIDLRTVRPRRALQHGIAMVPERRAQDGLAMDLSVQDNIVLPQVSRRRAWHLDRTWHSTVAREAISRHGIRTAGTGALVRELSGGNQQKVLLAKWLETEPHLLVLHEPTQAVDVGARRDILHRIDRAARSGTSVLIVSSETDDLIAACDRVLIHDVGGLRPARSTTPSDLLDEIFDSPNRTAS